MNKQDNWNKNKKAGILPDHPFRHKQYKLYNQYTAMNYQRESVPLVLVNNLSRTGELKK